MNPSLLDALAIKSDDNAHALGMIYAYLEREHGSADFIVIAASKSLEWVFEKEPPCRRATAKALFGCYVVDFDGGWYALFDGDETWECYASSKLDALKAADDHYLSLLKSLNI